MLCGTGWSHEVGHRYSSARYKCCRSCCQWHKKVWPWPEWPESYTMIYTGALWQIESPINLVSSCTEVSLARLCGTLLTVANWSLTLSVGGVSGQPHSNWWWDSWCHDTVSPLLAAEHSLCTARWCGTHCPTISMFSRNMSLSNRAEILAVLYVLVYVAS